MSSLITYKTQNNEKSELLSYCLESPFVVFEALFPKHKILQYGGIESPIDDEMFSSRYGLIIEETTPLAGTQIVQNISGLDVTVAEAELSEPRQPLLMRQAFRTAIEVAMAQMLDDHGCMGNYLDTYHLTQADGDSDIEYEKKVSQLLEIASVAFGIKDPTVDDLKGFLRS